MVRLHTMQQMPLARPRQVSSWNKNIRATFLGKAGGEVVLFYMCFANKLVWCSLKNKKRPLPAALVSSRVGANKLDQRLQGLHVLLLWSEVLGVLEHH